MAVGNEITLAGKFLRESLVRYETTVDEPIYPELWGYEGMYHSAIADLPFGSRGMMNARVDYTGQAVNYGGKATSIPLANYGIEMDEYKTMIGVLAADWTWIELQAEEASRLNVYLPRVDVIASYRNALDRGLKEWMHQRTVYGDPVANFNGLITNPYVDVISVSAAQNGVTAATADSASTYDWFIREASDFRKDSKLTSSATAILTSEDVNLAVSKRFTDGSSDGSPRRALTSGEAAQFTTIAAVNEMTGAEAIANGRTTINGVTIAPTDDLLMMFDANVSVNMVKHFHDIDYIPPNVLDDGLTWRQTGLCALSEVIFKQPFKSRLYVLKKS